MRAHDYPVAETPDLLLAAFERANDAVVIVDSDLHVTHFNAAAELIWGLNRAEILGRHVGRLELGDLQQHPVATSATTGPTGRDTVQGKQLRDRDRAARTAAGFLAALSMSRTEVGGSKPHPSPSFVTSPPRSTGENG